MVSVLEALILGIIQGITEWLPVSSSGHLALAQNFLGITQPVVFDLILHVGTLIVVFLVFYKELFQVIKGFFSFDKCNKDFMLSLYLIIATLITGVIGVIFNEFFVKAFENLRIIGIGFLITAMILFFSKIGKSNKKLGLIDSVFIGLAQALSILPGVSRSGSTIGIGLIRNVDRKEVAVFSFLLAIPAIIGGFVFQFNQSGLNIEALPLIIGFLTSFVVGYLSLKWLLKVIYHGNFHYFGWYVLVLGIITLIFSF